eukprot:14746842-Alexandrium_andersonii.AAC.1
MLTRAMRRGWVSMKACCNWGGFTVRHPLAVHTECNLMPTSSAEARQYTGEARNSSLSAEQHVD